MRSRQNGCHFPDEIFKNIFLNENVSVSIKISPKFVPKGPINNIPALVQVMAWHRPGDKPLPEPMLVSLLTHKCVTRPQWVKMKTWISNYMPQYYERCTCSNSPCLNISGGLAKLPLSMVMDTQLSLIAFQIQILLFAIFLQYQTWIDG